MGNKQSGGSGQRARSAYCENEDHNAHQDTFNEGEDNRENDNAPENLERSEAPPAFQERPNSMYTAVAGQGTNLPQTQPQVLSQGGQARCAHSLPLPGVGAEQLQVGYGQPVNQVLEAAQTAHVAHVPVQLPQFAPGGVSAYPVAYTGAPGMPAASFIAGQGFPTAGAVTLTGNAQFHLPPQTSAAGPIPGQPFHAQQPGAVYQAQTMPFQQAPGPPQVIGHPQVFGQHIAHPGPNMIPFAQPVPVGSMVGGYPYPSTPVLGPTLGTTAGNAAINQVRFAHANGLYEPQESKPADNPGRLYPMRQLDGHWTNVTRATIDHLYIRWLRAREGFFHTVRLKD